MGMFDGLECPVCGSGFTPMDDVVVCPVCGTPHHRDCWRANKACVNEAKHAEGWHWSRPQRDDGPGGEQTYVRQEVCPRCGEQNAPNTLFCVKCGLPLGAGAQPPAQPFAAPFGPRPGTPYGAPGIPFGSPYPQAYADPLGSVPPESEIDGVTAAELADYVGDGSHYYIPRFFRMHAKKSKASWSWPAFFAVFFPPGWAFYRKNYLLGNIMMAVKTVLVLLSDIIMAVFGLTGKTQEYFDYMNSLNTADMTPAQAEAALQKALEIILPVLLISLIILLVTAAIGVICGIFGNYIYMRNAVKNIKKARTETRPEERGGPAYRMGLRGRGGTSIGLALGITIGFFILMSMISSVITYFI